VVRRAAPRIRLRARDDDGGPGTFDRRPAFRTSRSCWHPATSSSNCSTETGLQIGLEATRATPLGSAPVTTIYREYQTFGAIKLPTVQVQHILGIEQVVTVTPTNSTPCRAARSTCPP
jgi:hypothetical protein